MLISSTFCSGSWWNCPMSYKASSEKVMSLADAHSSHCNMLDTMKLEQKKGALPKHPWIVKHEILSFHNVFVFRFQLSLLKFASFGNCSKGDSAPFTRSSEKCPTGPLGTSHSTKKSQSPKIKDVIVPAVCMYMYIIYIYYINYIFNSIISYRHTSKNPHVIMFWSSSYRTTSMSDLINSSESRPSRPSPAQLVWKLMDEVLCFQKPFLPLPVKGSLCPQYKTLCWMSFFFCQKRNRFWCVLDLVLIACRSQPAFLGCCWRVLVFCQNLVNPKHLPPWRHKTEFSALVHFVMHHELLPHVLLSAVLPKGVDLCP